MEPVELSMAVMKEIGSKWLVDAADYISNNPHIIVNGFIHAGISSALDGNTASVPNCEVDTTSEVSDDDDDDGDEEDNAVIDYIVL